MKKHYLYLLLLSLTMVSFYSNATIKTALGGNWNGPFTWSPAGIPTCGDTIMIPEGISVHIAANVDLDDPTNPICPSTHIIVAGTLTIANGASFEVALGVCIDFTDTGSLDKIGGGKGKASVVVGGVTEWESPSGPWLGPDNIGCAPILLPVELVDFSVTSINQSVELNFTSASERDLDYYVIESSRDGSYWQNLEQIKAAGNSLVQKTYSAIDNNPFNGVSYYRLTSTNLDGSKNVLRIISNEYYSSKFLMYPIPVNKLMFLEGENLEHSTISVVNSIGEMMEIDMSLIGDKYSFNFEHIKNGVYFLTIKNQKINRTERIIVAHK